MITVHEFGHYIVGKIFKFKINEFAIGMGPKIFRRQNKKTGEWFSIRALPLGGYCAFEGEDEASNVEGAFNSKEPYKRILVRRPSQLLRTCNRLMNPGLQNVQQNFQSLLLYYQTLT